MEDVGARFAIRLFPEIVLTAQVVGKYIKNIKINIMELFTKKIERVFCLILVNQITN